MKQKNTTFICGLLILGTVLITLFILANSFLDFSASHKLSGVIMKFLFPNTTETNGMVDDFWLRKTAHLVEYALLGAVVGGVIVYFRRRFSRHIIGGSLFGILSIAVMDEFIQGFNGRNSSVGDVILDFCGAVIGLGLEMLIIWFITYIKSKKKQKPLH